MFLIIVKIYRIIYFLVHLMRVKAVPLMKPPFHHNCKIQTLTPVFADCQSFLTCKSNTAGNPSFAEGFWVCRGLDLGHSAKALFAEGQPQEPSAKIGPRQRNGPRKIWPDGSRWPLASVFAECPPSGTRQRFFLNILCRGPLASAKIFYFF